MAYSSGKYGVQYHPPADAERHRLRWLLSLLAIITVASLAWYHFIRPRTGGAVKPGDGIQSAGQPLPTPPQASKAKENSQPARIRIADKPVERQASPRIPEASKTVVLPPPPPSGTVPPEAKLVEKWLDGSKARPAFERGLLEALASAERQGNVPKAIDAIERLYQRPTMADLKDRLIARLGELNLGRLLNSTNTPWTVMVTVRRGDSLERIARERRTTVDALRALNHGRDWAKIKPGDRVRTLDYQNAVLVVHKRLGVADLSLRNGRFFKRYQIGVAPSTKCDVYPVSGEAGKTMRSRFRELGLKSTQAERTELGMFLANGSSIIVAEQ